MFNWIGKFRQKKNRGGCGGNYANTESDINPNRETVRILQALLNEYKAEKIAATNWEHKKIILEILTVVGISVYTILTIFIWCEARHANKISQDALTDENRPWIKVTIVPNDIIWVGYGTPFAEMTASVYFQNVGHSPAIRVQMSLGTYLNGTKQTREGLQMTRCKALTQDSVVTDGRVIFPGDESEMTQQSPGVRQLIGVFKSAIDAAPPKLTENGTAYSFTIFGCADYVFGSQGQHYQTFFSYDVYRNMHEIVPFDASVMSAYFDVGKNFPAKDIVLAPSYDGNDAN